MIAHHATLSLTGRLMLNEYFISCLAGRFCKENDLSDVTCTLLDDFAVLQMERVGIVFFEKHPRAVPTDSC